MEIVRPTVATPITMPLFARAIQVAWPTVERTVSCTKERAACLWSQYAAETGRKHCYGWNFGNVKDSEGDGFDYQHLRGVWEGASKVSAVDLVRTKQAYVDPSVSHHGQVGAKTVAMILSDGSKLSYPVAQAAALLSSKEAIVDPDPTAHGPFLSMVFEPPHAATRFRWYPSLDVAMTAQLSLVKSRYGSGWDGVLAGNVDAFAKGLKLRGYFTADAGAYANLLRPNWRAYVADNAHEDARARLVAEGADTLPPDKPVGIIVHDLTTSRGLQRALRTLGFDPGPSDGVVGPRTVTAIRAFQRSKRLKDDGVVGPITRSALAIALADQE